MNKSTLNCAEIVPVRTLREDFPKISAKYLNRTSKRNSSSIDFQQYNRGLFDWKSISEICKISQIESYIASAGNFSVFLYVWTTVTWELFLPIIAEQ
jgi:hypothetical protein